MAAACAVFLLGCSSDGDGDTDDRPVDTTVETTTTESTTTTTESTTTTAPDTNTQEDAIREWVESEGEGPYIGPCPTEFHPDTPESATCSVPLGTRDDGEAHGLGPPASEIFVYVLLEDDGGTWSVTDSYLPQDPYDLDDAPEWVDGT